ncbi:MAG: hypothetical protein KatS3mg051_1944 [Anaerolineae bacterium]|nr:MAG: hypothetical protein KatS3mg051_1944 [Anaerolineae bacterium]
MELTVEQWTQIGIAAGMLLTALVTLVASLWLSRQTVIQVRRLLATLRGQEMAILAQIDEPTDALPVLVQRYTGIPAQVTSALLTALVKTVLEHLDVPVREVAVDETAR